MNFNFANNIGFLNEIEPELINAWLEIDLSNLTHNINYIRTLLPENTKIMGVVKADAYGHGSIETSQYLESNGVYCLGVANIAEAKILRQIGRKLPILVLGSVFKEQIYVALKYDIELAITSLKSLEDIINESKKLNKKADVHLKIDSGMGRVGVRLESLEEVLSLLKKSENINLKGVFTHFAEAEHNNGFTDHQIKEFEKALEIIKKLGFKSFIIHASNSSGIIVHPKAHFDMVRAGLAMYGISDPVDLNLKPVMSLKSKIINIKDIPQGNSLGYGRTFTTQRDSVIGTIPVGYADGLPRVLSNKQEVLIKGKRYPLVGNISMDQCLVDITDAESIEIGEQVTLLGNSGNMSIRPEEWASKSYRIAYEVLCGFGNRLPRVYT